MMNDDDDDDDDDNGGGAGGGSDATAGWFFCSITLISIFDGQVVLLPWRSPSAVFQNMLIQQQAFAEYTSI